MYASSSSIFLLIIIEILVTDVKPYNLENRLPLFKYGTENSKFGFSVAQHRLNDNDMTGAKDSVLVVGAPTTQVLTSEGNYETPGGVFYCPVSTNPDDCSYVQLDTATEKRTFGGINITNSVHWLGVSLRSKGPGDFLVACAHRYTTHQISIPFGPSENELVCGKCFLLEGTNSGSILGVSPFDLSLSSNFISSPCEALQNRNPNGRISSKTRYGYIQAGTSLSMTDSEYVVGGPGAWRWSGAIFSYEMPEFSWSGRNRNAEFHQTPTCFPPEWESNPEKKKCNDLPLNRDSYMGFSIATSNSITGRGNEVFYAAGAPRGNNTGAVVLFRKSRGRQDTIDLWPDYDNIVMGDAITSSFGYSIALTDINDDGLDDLIVGAPEYFGNNGRIGGAVYLYINEPGIGFKNIEPQVFYGPSDSKFGLTIAALGDIDQDGFNDFAVGSPYEDEYGVVHIYRGSANGIIKESQAIHGREYFHPIMTENHTALVGFGASLSGIVDSDSNKYPDLMIGSFSDHVTLIRSRPIIKVDMSFEVDREEIDLDLKNCTQGGDGLACFKMSYCFKYTSRHPEYIEDVLLQYSIIADTNKLENGLVSRIALNDSAGSSNITDFVKLPAANVTICPVDQLPAYFLNQMKDHLSEIGVKIEFDLVLPVVSREKQGEKIFDMIKDPILDADFENTKNAVVKINNSCGDDGCQSKLKLNASMPNELILGKMDTITVRVEASNPGEEAHQSYFTVSLPPNVTFERAYSPDSSLNKTCSQISVELVECDIGNPLKPNETIEFEVIFGVLDLDWKTKEIDVQVRGYTTSENPEIPEIDLQAKILLDLNITLTGYGSPEQVRYTQKEILGESIINETRKVGSLIVYTFDVINEGTRVTPELTLNIQLPYEIYNGKWLLYLVAAEVTAPGGRPAGSCDDDGSNINPLKMQPFYTGSKRSKRALPILVKKIQAFISPSSRNTKTILSCEKGANCITVPCLLEEMQPDGSLSVQLYLRLWEATFLEEKDLRTMDLVDIVTSANLTTDVENIRLNTSPAKVISTVDHAFFKDDIQAAFPWWYILIGAIILLLVYILIIWILIRCGFFRRRRHPRPNPEDENNTPRQAS